MAGATNKSGAADSARELTFRETWGENCITKLRTLPEALFQECVGRLQEGKSAIGVARWLLTVPDRGGMKKVTNIHTMRRYLEVLRVRVRAAKKRLPPPAISAKQLKKIVLQERRRADNSIALEGGPMKRQPEATPAPPNSPAEREPANEIATEGEPMKSEASPTPPPPARPEDRAMRHNKSMVEYLVERNAQASDQRLWLKCVAEVNWERLQLAFSLEEKVKMPLTVANAISDTIIKAAEAASRAELAASARHKQLGTKTTMENFCPITINGIPLNDPSRAHELPPHLQELQRRVRNMTVQDRMLLGTALDQLMNVMKLKLKLKREQEAQQAAQKPNLQPEGGKANE